MTCHGVVILCVGFHAGRTCWVAVDTRWFKYDRDDLCVNKSQFVPVIFEPPCILRCCVDSLWVIPSVTKISQMCDGAFDLNVTFSVFVLFYFRLSLQRSVPLLLLSPRSNLDLRQ